MSPLKTQKENIMYLITIQGPNLNRGARHAEFTFTLFFKPFKWPEETGPKIFNKVVVIDFSFLHCLVCKLLHSHSKKIKFPKEA